MIQDNENLRIEIYDLRIPTNGANFYGADVLVTDHSFVRHCEGGTTEAICVLREDTKEIASSFVLAMTFGPTSRF